MTLLYVPSGSIFLPNENQLRIIQAKTETPGARGTAVVPTYKLYGDLQLEKKRPLVARSDFTGGFSPRQDPVYGPIEVAGTYAQPLYYEDLSILARYLVKGQVAGVTDGNGTPGYTYTYEPSRAIDDIDSFTAEHGFPGMPFQSTLCMFSQATISCDMDDSEAIWKWSSNVFAKSKDLKAATLFTATSATSTTITLTAAGWTVNAFAEAYVEITGGVGVGQVRRIVSNTATVLTVSPAFVTTPDATSVCRISGVFTTGIGDRTREEIAGPGTDVYCDDSSPGVTNINDRVVSWSVTWNNGIYGKRMMDDEAGFSDKLGRGDRIVTGVLVMEFDTRTEYDNWEAKTRRYLRFEKIGSAINVGPNTFKNARIDVTRVFWDSPTMSLRQNNILVSMPFWAYYDSSAGEEASILVKTTQSVLP